MCKDKTSYGYSLTGKFNWTTVLVLSKEALVWKRFIHWSVFLFAALGCSIPPFSLLVLDLFSADSLRPLHLLHMFFYFSGCWLCTQNANYYCFSLLLVVYCLFIYVYIYYFYWLLTKTWVLMLSHLIWKHVLGW